jgi:enoyl-CoA hydratase/carnithine racemase
MALPLPETPAARPAQTGRKDSEMPDLLYTKYDTYAVFTMNRPERLNALGGTMQAELTDALAHFGADPAMRAGIVTGAGRAFSAGADLREMAERNAGTRPPAVRGGLESAMPFSRHAKPFIAAINGLCLAGGLERALDCDIRICSTLAYFGLFEVKRGILAGYAIHHLARLIPFGAAMYLLLTGDRIEPEQALRWGLVQEVLDPEALMPRAVAIAQLIAANAPLSVEGSKAVAQQWRQLQLDESYRFGQWVSRRVLSSADAQEGPRAFAEKRPAVWTGR